MACCKQAESPEKVAFMARKTVCIIGHFGFGKDLLNGQTVKSKILATECKRALGEEQVMLTDTHGGVKALLKLPFQTFCALRKCDNVVILPAHRGLRIITPLLRFWNLFFRRRLHYAVIGGWLATYLNGKKSLERQLKKFTLICPSVKALAATRFSLLQHITMATQQQSGLT